MRGAGAIALFLSVGGMLLAVWSCSYETTATPICGDTTLPSGQQCILWPSACGCTAGQRCGYDGTAFVCETPGTAGVGSDSRARSALSALSSMYHGSLRPDCSVSM